MLSILNSWQWSESEELSFRPSPLEGSEIPLPDCYKWLINHRNLIPDKSTVKCWHLWLPCRTTEYCKSAYFGIAALTLYPSSASRPFFGMIRWTHCHTATGALATTQPERNLIIAMGVPLGHIINLTEHMCPYCRNTNDLLCPLIRSHHGTFEG